MRRSTSAKVIASIAALSMLSPAAAHAQGSSDLVGLARDVKSVVDATAQVSSAFNAVAPNGIQGTRPNGSSLSSSSSSPKAPSGNHPRGDKPWSQVSNGIDVTMVGDLLGWHQTHVGLGALDLGIMVPIKTGQEFAVVFGDSFTGNGFGKGDWISPAGVVAHRDAHGRIIFDRPLNDGYQVSQLVPYAHAFDVTLIPSDIINIDGTLYMQGMWNKGIGNVLGTQIWRSTDNGASWEAISMTSPTYMRGNGNLISWEKGPDGYIYVVSSEFKRQDPVYLSRFKEEDIANRRAWEIYNPATGSWGATGAPILTDNVKAGEMSLRYIDGHWVLAMFNAQTRSIEVRISENIAHNWNEIAPARVVVSGEGGWGRRQNENNFTQLYGGYIVPGSTLGNLDLVVSQWNTSDNSRYMSTQFNVKGLDKFFGVTPDRRQAGKQSVVEVEEGAVTDETLERMGDELVMENAADVTIAPAKLR